ncbi:MAG: fatty-acid oxidation protein subunit alpha, partial [Pseudanabaena sp. CRU_2_10]|nr:fatty-acid oxidation protein subunit alpha [Pseudanabaena sp. CRU_2_10]
NYRYALEIQEPERVLYLAVPSNTYNDFFMKSFIQLIVQRSQINLLVYDVEKEEIERWQT